MTEQDIAAGNKIIGDYMGKCYKDPLNYMYDKSWDWLMPVVHKCCDDLKKLGFDARGSYNPRVGYVSEIYVMRLNNSIEKVWEECINHITRFNK